MTIHQLEWSHLRPNEPDIYLQLEITFVATSGAVKFERSGLSVADASGQAYGSYDYATDDGLHPPLAATGILTASQQEQGWVTFLLLVEPIDPVEIRLVDLESRTQLATWTIDGPPATTGPATGAVPTT